MTSRTSVPLHLRLVLVNGVVFASGVLAMSLAPEDERGPVALLVLGVGLVAVLAVNTRHLRQSLTPLLSALGVLRHRWESEHRAQAARSLATQEYDAHRMAAQLHDKVGAHLAATLVSLKKAIDHAPPELADELRAVQHDAQNTFVEIRRITRRLRPETLEDLGLQSALGFLLDDLARKVPGIAVDRHLEGPFPGIDEEVELVLYRVAEEALRNVARHARARHVVLGLRHDDGRVLLTVTDDGVGVGDNGARGGIHGMRERAALVGGRLEVVDLPDGGAQVRLEVPAHPARTP